MRRCTLLLATVAAAVGMVVVAAGCTSSKPAQAIVRIGPAAVEFRVEVAQTAEQQRDGLSGRESLSEGTGMLFRFGSRREQQVWMVGMEIPIDIAWIVDGKVLAVDTLQPCTEPDQKQCSIWTSPSAADGLLEVPAHSLAAITPGMSLTIAELT